MPLIKSVEQKRLLLFLKKEKIIAQVKEIQTMAKVIAQEEFENVVLNSTLPVVVDFFATWCGPCKMIAPMLEQLSVEYEGKVTIVKVDVDDAMDLSDAFEIVSVPTLLFFKNGQVVHQMVGAGSKAMLKATIEKVLL